MDIQNFDDNYIKDARAWWAIVIGVFGAGILLAALGSFFLGWGMIIFWYYTPNVKMACHCSGSLIKIYDLWPFIKKPDRRYMFPNSILAYSAFINKNYQESVKWADEWILNADGPANNDNNEIDEAWVLQVVVVDDNPTCKEEMPVIKVNILPGETVKFRVYGQKLSGGIQSLNANDINVKISDPSVVHVEKIYQNGQYVFVELKCRDIGKNGIIQTFIEWISGTSRKQRAIDILIDDMLELKLINLY